MAWTITDRASVDIGKADTPYIDDALRAHVTDVLMPRYETPLGALMETLHEVQHRHGHVPYQAMVEVADLLGIAPSQVLDVVSFYEEYHAEPVGEHVIAVCQSIACEVCGHQAILDHLKSRLGIGLHETSEDGKFTLLALECLGSCDTAPCALVGDKRCDNLTISALDEIIDELEAQ